MKQAWNQMAQVYNKLMPPQRPGKGDLKIFSELIRPRLKDNINILLCGSTPELRDVLYTACLTYNADLTVVDLSADMYGAMTILTERENSKERFVNKAWQDTGLESKKFDLILGDEIIVNVPLEYRDKFFSELVRLLKDDGVFITRHDFVDPKDKKLNSEFIKKEFQDAIDLKQTIGQALNNLSAIITLHLAASRPNQIISVGDIIDELPILFEIIKDNQKMKAIYNEIVERSKIFEPTRDQAWIYKDNQFNEIELKKYFKIVSSVQPDNPVVGKNIKIYCLSPL